VGLVFSSIVGVPSNDVTALASFMGKLNLSLFRVGLGALFSYVQLCVWCLSCLCIF